MEKKLFESAIGKLREIIEGDERFRLNTYLVGGCVRDLLLGETPKDIDLCIDYPEGSTEFIKYLEQNYPKTTVSGFTIFERYGTSRFTLHLNNDENVDIECVIPRVETYNQGPRKPDQVKQTTLQEDAMRRDFCCNAIYKNLETGEYIDPTGKGVEDVENKILRTPLDPEQTYIDDPLRMLRAIRFYCTKGFEIEKRTKEYIKNYKEFDLISPERVRDEFDKILMSGRAIEGIRMMIDTKLIYKYIPELIDYKDFDQHNKYHSLNWLEHSLSVLKIVMKNNPNASLELRLAALLHDISKPKVYEVKEDGTYSYHGHEKKSAERAKEILEGLKYSNKEIEKICFLIKNHMILKPFYSYETHQYTGRVRNTRKILREIGDNLEELLELIEADNLSHSPEWNMIGQVESFKEKVNLLEENGERKEKYIVPVSGNDIMKWFDIKPGKLVKEIKDILQEMYEEDPTLQPEDLKKLFIKKYEGVFLWFAKENEGYYSIFSHKPIKRYGFWCSNGEVPYKVKEISEEIPDKELIYLEAKFYPKIYDNYIREKKVRKIIKKLEESLSELEKLKNFESINLSLEGYDLYAKIKFLDGEETEII